MTSLFHLALSPNAFFSCQEREVFQILHCLLYDLINTIFKYLDIVSVFLNNPINSDTTLTSNFLRCTISWSCLLTCCITNSLNSLLISVFTYSLLLIAILPTLQTYFGQGIYIFSRLGSRKEYQLLFLQIKISSNLSPS